MYTAATTKDAKLLLSKVADPLSAKKLSELGVPTARSKSQWTDSAVKNILMRLERLQQDNPEP